MAETERSTAGLTTDPKLHLKKKKRRGLLYRIDSDGVVSVNSNELAKTEGFQRQLKGITKLFGTHIIVVDGGDE